VQKTFDFFRSTTAPDHIDRIVLSGGASRTEGSPRWWPNRFDTAAGRGIQPVQGHRLRRAEVRAPSRLPTAAAASAVAVGLALAQGGRPMICRSNLLAVERSERSR